MKAEAKLVIVDVDKHLPGACMYVTMKSSTIVMVLSAHEYSIISSRSISLLSYLSVL